jgi:hypothetical protein
MTVARDATHVSAQSYDRTDGAHALQASYADRTDVSQGKDQPGDIARPRRWRPGQREWQPTP